ncbi:MAG: ATP-binding protein [Deltaproteobacteria bacterium]|nr:ATP-binding protein [Candidatus Tharpellaceae bacterium]
MHKRNLYMERVKPFIDKPVVKVITGLRRVGKSYFMRQIMEYLRDQGIDNQRIIYIDKESVDFDFINNYQQLHDYIKTRPGTSPGSRNYLFIDEVQEIKGWEKCIASCQGSDTYDIYLTGSNASMLSSDLASLLSGRYIEFPLYSLGFREFLDFMGRKEAEAHNAFPLYLRYGGFPALPHFDLDAEVVYQYVSALYNTILLKDVVKRYRVRNITLLENITKYAFDNIGNIFSAKKVSDYIKSQKLSISVETVQNYLSYLCSTFALHKVQRYDIKGKRILELHEKYYLGDIALRHALLGYRESDIAGMLENLVFLELKRRGYNLFIGKYGTREIDFIATKADEKLYIQVCYLLASEQTIEREFQPLLSIKDNYPKYVLSMDTIFGSDYDGIKRLNIVDFLLQPIDGR